LPFIEKATEIVADSRSVGSIVVCNVLCKVFDSRHGELAEQVRKEKKNKIYSIFMHFNLDRLYIQYYA